MPFAEDLSTFFNAAEFATSVVLAGVGVDAIFDNGYAQATVGLSGMAGSQPSLTLPSANVPPQIIDWFLYFSDQFNPIDLLVSVNGVNYKIAAHEPDGLGVSKLILELA